MRRATIQTSQEEEKISFEWMAMEEKIKELIKKIIEPQIHKQNHLETVISDFQGNIE